MLPEPAIAVILRTPKRRCSLHLEPGANHNFRFIELPEHYDAVNFVSQRHLKLHQRSYLEAYRQPWCSSQQQSFHSYQNLADQNLAEAECLRELSFRLVEL